MTFIGTNQEVITYIKKRKQKKKTPPQHIQLIRLGADNLCAGSQALCMSATFGQCGPGKFVSEQLQSKSVWGMVSCQFWLARVWAGWVAADAPHHLPSCRHPVQGVLGGVNRGAHCGGHGCGLTRRAGERAAVSLQDACALPVVHVVCCRGTQEVKISAASYMINK